MPPKKTFLATEKPLGVKKAGEIAKGLYEGCKESNIPILGGEMATLKEIVKGFDLAGTALGIGKKEQLIFLTESGPVRKDYSEEMAAKIASRGPLAIAHAKEAVNRGINTTLDAGCEHEASLFAGIRASKDKNEGTRAFLEKRPAKFVGK